jgi:hypothetical protein
MKQLERTLARALRADGHCRAPGRSALTTRERFGEQGDHSAPTRFSYLINTDQVFGTHKHDQIISGVGPFLERRAIERHAYTCREQFVSRGDKAVRAQSMRGRMAMLGLYVRQGAPWFADLRAELLSFPAGKHDDQVDALGLVGQLLDKISAGPRPKPPEVTQRDGYCAAFEQMPDDSWKTM